MIDMALSIAPPARARWSKQYLERQGLVDSAAGQGKVVFDIHEKQLSPLDHVANLLHLTRHPELTTVLTSGLMG